DIIRTHFEILADLAAALGVSLQATPELERLVILAATTEPRDFTLGDERFSSASARSAVRSPSSALRAGSVERSILSGGGTWLHDPSLAKMRIS
ncbi:MAG: hypothetical protein WBX26_13135, partial [Candidatus Cybelea sp.]